MSDRICTMPGCERKHCARGLCKNHYYAAGHGFQAHPCRVPACEFMTTSKTGDGLCEMHYARRRRTGMLSEGKYYKPWLDAADVLWDRSAPHGECILWTGALTADGYGSVNAASWAARSPHRISWMLLHGPIPEGMEIDHVCHNNDRDCTPVTCLHRRCINPDHLELVTHDENMRRQFERVS